MQHFRTLPNSFRLESQKKKNFFSPPKVHSGGRLVNDFLILMKISQLARAALVVILVVAVLCSVDMVQGTVMETTNVLATSNVALTTA